MPPVTKVIKIDARRDFVRRVLPWLAAVAMLAVYILTLNHWVSTVNIDAVSELSGWSWTPQVNCPVYFLATLPFRLLPTPAIPLALNLFSAVCAALAMGLLARSVGLLPHDRTEAQAARERNDFYLLTLRGAWFPTLLAVALCGLQLTYWEQATNGGFETFDLLLFALVVWQLLEYRLDEKEWRLFWSAAITGAAIAEDVMTGFFPLFIVAILWVRGLNFFNLRFLGRMALCGLAGLLLVLVLPMASVLSGKVSLTFLQVFWYGITPQIQMLKAYYYCVSNAQQYFEGVLMPLFIALMPLLILSIRWKFGDSSRLGSMLSNLMFHTIHAIFFGVCVWLVFDPPFSPREKGFGLTLYYLVALSAGYYAGYFLLIFGKKNPRLEEVPTPVVLFNLAVVACVWLFGILAVTGLIYKNAPLIRDANGDMLSQYALLVNGKLPKVGAIVMSDDAQRLYLAQAALTRDGRAKDYLMVNTAWLPWPDYHRYLYKKSPQKWPLPGTQQTNMFTMISLIVKLATINKTNEIYYLHPSFGYYFEEFYPEPHGLVYKLKVLPDSTLLPTPPDENLIAENNAFWKAAKTDALASIEDAVAPPEAQPQGSFVQHMMARLHIPHEQNENAILIGRYCSRSLNFWGVELQRSGDLTDAGAYFDMALRYNTNNIVAEINRGVNADLSAGRRPGMEVTQNIYDQLGKFDTLLSAVTEGGPFDEPNFCYNYGYAMAQENGYFRQAVEPLERVHKLDPNFLPGRILLAQIYARYHMPDEVLEVLREPLNRPEDFSASDADLTELNIVASAAYFQKNELAHGTQLLETVVSRNPTNEYVLTLVERVYISRGMFTNALAIVNHTLSFSPNDPNWLLTKGYVDNQLNRFDDAIAALNRVLAVQTNDPNALWQRANAYLGKGSLEAAQTDYGQLQQSNTNSPQAAYGLGEIAWRQHETNEAIRNYEIYVNNAPTNTVEAKTVIGRLRELKQPSGGK